MNSYEIWMLIVYIWEIGMVVTFLAFYASLNDEKNVEGKYPLDSICKMVVLSITFSWIVPIWCLIDECIKLKKENEKKRRRS